jgi:hypothetical protein
MTAHSKKDEHGGYGEYPAKELKAASSGCGILWSKKISLRLRNKPRCPID